MAKFKFEILAKVQDPAEVRALYDAEPRSPKCIVQKRVGEFQTDYLLCVPYIGDEFDRRGSQMLFLDIAHREDVADQDAAEAARGGSGDIDGLTLEHTNTDGTVSVYSDDGQYLNYMIAEKAVVEVDGSHSNDGAHRAEEGWEIPTQIKPSGQAFNDSKKGVAGADSAGFDGNTLN